MNKTGFISELCNSVIRSLCPILVHQIVSCYGQSNWKISLCKPVSESYYIVLYRDLNLSNQESVQEIDNITQIFHNVDLC